MSSVNTPNKTLDPTTRIYDQFYEFEASVPTAEFDIVYSFFKTIYKTKEAALAFTTTLFRVAFLSNTPVLNLLEQLQSQGNDSISINALVCYYLNGIRSPSTLLGVSNGQTPNYYTARNIVP